MKRNVCSRRAFAGLLLGLGAAVLPARAEDKQQPISEDLLYDRVNRALITDRELGARNLEVKVDGATVTVTGFVESEKQQKKVDKVVKKVDGVAKVVNETKIRPWL